ncbi:hypothetical protein SFC43_35100 [Bacteroides sp. CR5/BHMF/2]|nr:hypothetical protein [Bacteroides sp. CR5/BHMF/2]
MFVPAAPYCLTRFSNRYFPLLGFAMTNRLILCLQNFTPVSATTFARPSAKAG